MSSGTSNNALNIRELIAVPGMNTMDGFEGSPATSVQIFVPSSDVINLLFMIYSIAMGCGVRNLRVSVVVAGFISCMD